MKTSLFVNNFSRSKTGRLWVVGGERVTERVCSGDLIRTDNIGKIKVNYTLVQALRLCTGRTADRGSRGIALL